MPGDHTTPRSYSNPANSFATERRYLPNDSVNAYGADDALTLTPVGGGGNNGTPSPSIHGFLIPVTGFAPNTITKLNSASRPVYDVSDLTIEIPAIKLQTSIVGVKLERGDWDVSWLQNQVGWLDGTAYPTWTGNSVLTAHSINTSGRPSIFYNLKGLRAGDFIYVNNGSYRYTYKVLSNQAVPPNDITLFRHEKKAYLTLITCDNYDIKTSTYRSRIAIRAVLVDVSVTK
jgi:LPXTG-site transpeptidase (sortase) family protein